MAELSGASAPPPPPSSAPPRESDGAARAKRRGRPPPSRERPSKRRCAAGLAPSAAAGGGRSSSSGPPYWPSGSGGPPPPRGRAAGVREAVLAFLGYRPRTPLLELLERSRRADSPSSGSLFAACEHWRLTLEDLEAIAMPAWGFDGTFRDWEAFQAFVDPVRHDFMDGEAVEYWSDTHRSWLGAMVRARHHDRAGRVTGYDLDVKAGAIPGKIRRRCAPARAREGRSVDRPRLLGEECGVDFTGPDGLRYRSVAWAALLDGTVRARLMTDSYPTRAPGQDSTFSEGILRSLRRLPWSPEHHWRYPGPCRRRMTFLAWVGGMLGLQPAWTRAVLPLVGWADALPEPPHTGGLTSMPPSPASSSTAEAAGR